MSVHSYEHNVTPSVVPGPVGRLLLHDGTASTRRPDLAQLTALLDEAGLTGRGGAGFPTGRKLAAVASQKRRPALVINAMEGEPLARKDETLLALAPGLVLDGAEILANALGARRAVIAVGEQIPPIRVRAAVAERRSRVRVEVLDDTFVGGEASAVISALNGRAGVPTDPATPTWQRGLDGRPTMVVNTETAAQLALLVDRGAAWFRQAGTPEDPGTFLLSVSGTTDDVIGSGVTEAGRGTPLLDVLTRFRVQEDLIGAVLIGGYHGAWLPPSVLRTPLDKDSLAPLGASTGAGVIHVLDRRDCPLEVTARIVAYLADQSARQCGPCVNGLPRLATTFTELATSPRVGRAIGAGPELATEVARLAALVEGRGACAHPDGTVRLVRSALRTFADHVDEHLEGRCSL